MARIAISDSGFDINKYYSSEIDKFALKVCSDNFPQDDKYCLGDMTKLKKRELLKLGKIDILIGGSSCTDFSSIGKKQGMITEQKYEITTLKKYLELKKKGVKFVGESYLFWEFVRILMIVKPKYFLLENVKMSKKWVSTFEEALGVKATIFNSSLVVPQNRERFYFTNIKGVIQPEDTNSTLDDILEDIKIDSSKADMFYNDGIEYTICHSIKPQIRNNIKNNILEILSETKNFHTMKHGVSSGFADNKIALKKSMTIRAQNNATYVKVGNTFRRFTDIERERLQGVPDGFTSSVSSTQRVKITGNGFTVPIISHILTHINK